MNPFSLDHPKRTRAENIPSQTGCSASVMPGPTADKPSDLGPDTRSWSELWVVGIPADLCHFLHVQVFSGVFVISSGVY